MSFFIRYIISGILFLSLALCLCQPVFYTHAFNKNRRVQRSAVRRGGDGDAMVISCAIDKYDEYYDAEEKELNIDGTMYELLDARQEGELMICKVLADEKETKLKADYAHALKKGKTGKDIKQPRTGLLQLYWEIHKNYCCFTPYINDSGGNRYALYRISDGYMSHAGEPPEVVAC